MSEVMARDEDTVVPLGFRKLGPSFLTEQTPLPPPLASPERAAAAPCLARRVSCIGLTSKETDMV